MILINPFKKKTSILKGTPYRKESINPHCLPTDQSPHENESLSRSNDSAIKFPDTWRFAIKI